MQIQYMHSFGFCEFLIMHLILHTCVLRYGYWKKVFEYFECPSNIGSTSIKKSIHAVNRLNMAACTLMYPLRLFFFWGGGVGDGDGDIKSPPPI